MKHWLTRSQRIIIGTVLVFNVVLLWGYQSARPAPEAPPPMQIAAHWNDPVPAPTPTRIRAVKKSGPHPDKALLRAFAGRRGDLTATGSTIIRIAREEGVPPEILLAMAHVESQADPYCRGDKGKSIGVFQIQYKLHKVTPSQCRNVEFAARWTARRLKQWRRGLWYGVYRHNGYGRKARQYAARVRALAGSLAAEAKLGNVRGPVVASRG